jgi:beta-N-acetylglucosaminidase
MNLKRLISKIVAFVMLMISLQHPMLAAGFNSFGQAEIIVEKYSTLENYSNGWEQKIDTLSQPQPVKQTKTQIYQGIREVKEEKMVMVESGYIETTGFSLTESQEMMIDQETNREFLASIKQIDVTRLDLRKPSGLTGVQADHLLKGTGLEGLGNAFVEAEKKYQVNAYYLIAHAAWESGWGKSRISREKNNIFGFQAYDNSPYRSAKSFTTKEESIDVVTKYISEQYLSEDGKHYHGSDLKGMNVRYATDQNWNKGIAKVIKGLASKTQSIDLYAA